MVRLKEINRQVKQFNSILFQFLNGAIKSRDLFFSLSDQRNFNSSMVRLKVEFIKMQMIMLLYFNSSMVRLKDDLALLSHFD